MGRAYTPMRCYCGMAAIVNIISWILELRFSFISSIPALQSGELARESHFPLPHSLFYFVLQLAGTGKHGAAFTICRHPVRGHGKLLLWHANFLFSLLSFVTFTIFLTQKSNTRRQLAWFVSRLSTPSPKRRPDRFITSYYFWPNSQRYTGIPVCPTQSLEWSFGVHHHRFTHAFATYWPSHLDRSIRFDPIALPVDYTRIWRNPRESQR